MSERFRTYNIASDGVLYRRYNDGSERFVLHIDRAGSPNSYGGINERLYAQWRGRKPPKDVLIQRSIGISRTATTLLYEQYPRFWRGEGDKRQNHFRAIHSDLNRMHAPQSWSAGFMPIIVPWRFNRWLVTRQRSTLEFNIPSDPEQLRSIARSYILLIVKSWGNIETTKMLRGILNNIGIGVNGKVVREILDTLMEEEYLTVRHCAYNANGMWGFSPRVRRYSWNSKRPGRPSMGDSFDDCLAYEMSQLAEIATPFEACAKEQL